MVIKMGMRMLMIMMFNIMSGFLNPCCLLNKMQDYELITQVSKSRYAPCTLTLYYARDFLSLSLLNYLWMVTGRWTLVLNGGCNSIIRILGHWTCKTNIKIIWCTPYYQKKMNKNPCFFLHIFSSWCFLHKHFVSSSSTLLILNLFLLYRCIDPDAIRSIWYKQCAKGGLRGGRVAETPEDHWLDGSHWELPRPPTAFFCGSEQLVLICQEILKHRYFSYNICINS